MMVNFFVVRACQVISAFCLHRMHVCLPISAEIINNISKTFGRSLSASLCRFSLNVHRAKVFSKAQKQKTEVVQYGETVSKSWGSAADTGPAEKVTRKNNGIHLEFSPHAKTHQRCAADLQAAASAADLYRNR